MLAAAAIGLGLSVKVEGRDSKPRPRSTVSFHTFRHACASLLFDDGRNVKQVQDWLGCADPGFTLSTYVHLMDAGLGAGIDFQVGNGWATQDPTKAENAPVPDVPDLAS